MTGKTRYTKEFQAKALRLPEESRANHSSETKAVASVAQSLGMAPETLRRWRNKADRAAVVDHYLTHGRRAGRTIRRSGHPGREVLAAWLDGLAPGERRLRHGPVSEELEREAVPRVASGGMTSRRTRRSRAWIRRSCGTGGGDCSARRKGPWAAKGEPEREDVAAQTDPDVPRGGIAALNADPERLRAEYRAMETGPVIMRGSVEPVGKAPGADPDDLTDREKALPVKRVGGTSHVNAESPLDEAGIARGTYYYRLKAMNRPDKDMGPPDPIRGTFGNGRRRCGCRRVRLGLEGAGVVVCAKRVMRPMTAHGLVPVFRSAKRRSSYKGGIGGAPADLVDCGFHAANPNEPWVTDITGFAIPAGEVCLSSVIDCYDGVPVAWTIGASPDAALADGMPGDACSTLGPGGTPIVHSDRGCRYRWDEWIRVRGEHDPTRSMSAKGRGPDDAAAEGFFGRLRRGFFRKRGFQGVSIDGFITLSDGCMVRYRDRRIKTEYGMGVMDKRIEFGLVA